MPMRALIDLPEIEYLDGEAYPKVSPTTTHATVQFAVARLVHAAAQGRGRVMTELDVYPRSADRTDTKLVPDVAFVSRERLHSIPKDEREDLPFSPDVAIEVWSPSNDRRYLERKIARYLETGTTLVLDVDPYARTIVAHTAEATQAFACEDRFEHAAIPWLQFAVADAFADLDD